MPYKVKEKCVYKKDTGKKVGCTKGSVKKYLAALHMHENKIKKMLREEFDDLQWIHDVPTLFADNEELNEKIKALHKVVGSEAIFGNLTKPFDVDDILSHYDWYGITNFELEDGTEWVVGTEEEFNNALYEYWYSYVDDVGLDYINQYDLIDFIEMYEGTRQEYANNEADYSMYKMTDEDILERSADDEEYEELEEQIYELRNEIEYEDEDGVGELRNKISELEEKQLNLLDRARELVLELLYEEWYECLEDPYECLVDTHGYYSSVNDLIDNGLVHFDQEEFASSYASSENWYDLPTYGDGFDYVDGYIITRIN